MKAIIFIALIAFASASFLEKSDEEIFYEEWAQEHIDYVNSIDAGWTAGHNKYFEGRSLKTVKANLGGLPSDKSKYELTKIDIPESFADNFNSQTEWPNCKSLFDIRNQANCGCCWAFGASEAFSDRICIASNQTKQISISAEDTCFCPLLAMGCHGGNGLVAWGHYELSGAVTGLDYNSPKDEYCANYGIEPCCLKYEACTAELPTCPNVDSHPSLACPSQCNSAYGKSFKADKHYAKGVGIIMGETHMQAEIQKNGPIECAFSVYSDFMTYRTGVYKHTTGSKLGGHCIKVIGWGEENGDKYWLVANSWSTYWGDKGYFKIARGSDECGIEMDCNAGVPA